jgi:hypothetical protein
MSIAITEDHRALAQTARDLLASRGVRAAARELLEADVEVRPDFWTDLAEIGWLGLHLPEQYSGSGFGLDALVVVVEELGRVVAPGPFVPTVVTSAVIAATADEETRGKYLPLLADGTFVGAVALGGAVDVRDGKASGSAGVVLSGALADVLLVVTGDDVVLLDGRDGVAVDTPKNFDPTRRSSRISLESAPVRTLVGARQLLTDYARLLFSAEAVGIARECTVQAAEYAKVREQFGRPIAMFQAVKHHCADMLVATELATSAVWDAARAASVGGAQFSYASAMAAALAAPAADLCANLDTQVQGGIAMTWEHDAHLYMRRAIVLSSVLEPDVAAADLANLTRAGVVRAKDIDLPQEADAIREEVRRFASSVVDLPSAAQRDRLIETGYVMPHWPKPWGREASAVEQLVIEQEFAAAGIERPAYGITGWVILTLIQHGTADQVARWVPPALRQDVIWCQLFSEPDAGSDAAGIKTRATRVDGGWKINGQKVWTSGAHVAGMGFATVRTNPDVPKHEGITMVVIDMHAPGVEVRPLRMTTGQSEFNEVFFTDVFVSDDDVVGPIDGGWTVARATLGNESVSIGGGEGSMAVPGEAMIELLDAHPERLSGGPARIGRYVAQHRAVGLLNLRSAQRAVVAAGPGPEGAITKLVLSEVGHDAAHILAELTGPDIAFMEGDNVMTNYLVLFHRGISIAGGTSEIKRNQIGERILGLPRDPLVK